MGNFQADAFGGPPIRPTSAPAPVKPAASRLAAVKKGRIAGPIRVVIYGPEGVGKTTLVSSAPDPILFDADGGSKNLDVPRYSFRDEEGGHVPRTFQEILDGIDDLLRHDHPYRTLGIDTADRVESLLHRFILERDSVRSGRNKGGKKLDSIEDYGYGKGYQFALDEWRRLCARLDELSERRKMNIVILGHTSIRTWKNPDSDDYDRWVLRLNEKAAGFLKEWADVTGFFSFEERGGKLDGADDRERAKGYSTGRRLLRFQRTATVDAKTRLPLPAEVEVAIDSPWTPLAEAIDAARNATPADLRTRIAEELARISDADLSARVKIAVSAAGEDGARLHRFLNDLKARPSAVTPDPTKTTTEDDSDDSNKEKEF